MVTLRELKEKLEPGYFVLQVPTALIPKSALISEGVWVDSGKSDWMIRVDAEKPSIHQQRHVHVARSKHANSKNMHASWNQDTSRHDKKSFNTKVGSLSVVQDIARQALGLPSNAILEAVTGSAELEYICESIEADFKPELFAVIIVVE